VPVFPEKARFGYINAERVDEILNTEIIGSDGAFGEAADGAVWARSGAVRNKIRVMTADIVDIATDLEALEKKPGAFDPVCLRLRFEWAEGLEEGREENPGRLTGVAERFIVVSFVFVFYLWFVPLSI